MVSREEVSQPKSNETCVDEQASHRHDPPQKSAACKKQSSTSTKTPKNVKRPCPLRESRSKNFIKVLEIPKKMKSLSVRSEIVVRKHERHFTIAASSGVTYDAEINKSPNCSCKYGNDRDVCSTLHGFYEGIRVPEMTTLRYHRLSIKRFTQTLTNYTLSESLITEDYENEFR